MIPSKHGNTRCQAGGRETDNLQGPHARPATAAPKHILHRFTTEHTHHLGVCEVIWECTVRLQVNAPSSVCTQLLVRTPTDSTQQGPEGKPSQVRGPAQACSVRQKGLNERWCWSSSQVKCWTALPASTAHSSGPSFCPPQSHRVR